MIMKKFLKNYGIFLAWLIAVAAFALTLFFSDVLHWPVCNLCWYQRIAIYPLVILLGVGAYRDDHHVAPYAKIFCAIGFILGLYQYAEQMIPGFEPIQLCTQGVSCADTPIKLLGFITIPFLSMVACVAMYLLLSQD